MNVSRYVGNGATGATDPSGLLDAGLGTSDADALAGEVDSFDAGAFAPPGSEGYFDRTAFGILDRNWHPNATETGTRGWVAWSVGMMGEVSSLAPGAGDIRDAFEVSTGIGMWGERLSPADRAMSGAAAGIPMVSGRMLRLLRRPASTVFAFAGEATTAVASILPLGWLRRNADEAVEEVADVVADNVEATSMLRALNPNDPDIFDNAVVRGTPGSISNVPDESFVPGPNVTTPYDRPTAAGPNTDQRNSVQGLPCVECNTVTPNQVADHVDPLSVQHYREGAVNIVEQARVSAVQPHCPDCSNLQGGLLSAFVARMNAMLGFRR